jgi:hypothetical protein
MALQNETRVSELYNSSGDDISRFCTNIFAIDYLLPVETTVALVTQALPLLKSYIHVSCCSHLQALLSYKLLERFKTPRSKQLSTKESDKLKAKLIGVRRVAIVRVLSF